MRPMLSEINQAATFYFRLAPDEMMSTTRARRVARPRQIAMFLAREMTVRSYPEIARSLGGMDHTTIMHGVRNIANLIERVPEVASDVRAVRHLVFAMVNQRIKAWREAA